MDAEQIGKLYGTS